MGEKYLFLLFHINYCLCSLQQKFVVRSWPLSDGAAEKEKFCRKECGERSFCISFDYISRKEIGTTSVTRSHQHNWTGSHETYQNTPRQVTVQVWLGEIPSEDYLVQHDHYQSITKTKRWNWMTLQLATVICIIIASSPITSRLNRSMNSTFCVISLPKCVHLSHRCLPWRSQFSSAYDVNLGS